jgi:hypothetical protein
MGAGDPLVPKTTMGPPVTTGQRQHVLYSIDIDVVS